MKQTEKPNMDISEIRNTSEMFEVTIITEELSENEEDRMAEELSENEEVEERITKELSENKEVEKRATEELSKNEEFVKRVTEQLSEHEEFEKIVTEELSENEEVEKRVTEELFTNTDAEEKITQDLSVYEDFEKKVNEELFKNEVQHKLIENLSVYEEFEKKITKELSINETVVDIHIDSRIREEVLKECPDEEFLHYFAEQEKYDADLKTKVYSDFLKKIEETSTISDKMYLVNCDTYEENIFREVCESFGRFEIISYLKNGHLKLPTAKNVRNFDLDAEIALPSNQTVPRSIVFSPVKSECSFDLSNDYDAKLEEMVNKTSKQEVLEIILGGVIDESSSAMPTIDYCTESNIISDSPMKRKAIETENSVNNRHILTPNKIRKLSGSEQISSTTEETEESSNNNKIPITTRSKHLGRAKRIGLSKSRKLNHPNSPSSDKSVENYEQNSTSQPPNGKLKTTQRIKIQRYDTSDLYKPKLHYLSRRNNIS